MAKKYGVTRTIEKTNVTALIFNKSTAEPCNVTVSLVHPVKDSKALERAVRKIVESNDNIKLIEIVDIETTTKVLGITEEQFLSMAVELDPKTRKPIEA